MFFSIGGDSEEPSPAPPVHTSRHSSYNIDALAYAVAVAETGGCTDGTAIKRKNCHGIMRFWYENGVRHREPKYFKSHDASYAEFKFIWQKSYKRFPDMTLANKWTGGDASTHWLNNVITAYCRRSPDHNCPDDKK